MPRHSAFGGRWWTCVARWLFSFHIRYPVCKHLRRSVLLPFSFHKAMVAPKRHRAKGGGKVEQKIRGAGHDDIIAAMIANSVIEPEAAAR